MVIKSGWDALLHGDIFAYLSLFVCVPQSLCWASIRATAVHVKAVVQTQKKQEPTLGKKTGFGEGTIESQVMALGLKTAVEERNWKESSGWVRIRMGSKSRICENQWDKKSVWRVSIDVV